MSIVKIALGTLVAVTSICSVMYYFTLYQNPPVPTATEPTLPAPTAAFMIASASVTATPEIEPKKPVKKAAAHHPRSTAHPKPHKVKRTPQQLFPFGKPKPTPKP
jgi:hypothetical protein